MLSNRITAKSLELNPARQARNRILKQSKDCHPAGWVSPPDRPPLPPPPAAAPARLFPCTELPELLEALCLPSLAAWCSAISARERRSDSPKQASLPSSPVPLSAPRGRKLPSRVNFLSLWSLPGSCLYFLWIGTAAVTSPLAGSRATQRSCALKSASRLNAGGKGRGLLAGRGVPELLWPITNRQVREGGV